MADAKVCPERCVKTTAESKFCDFDFTADMETAETISTATAAVTPSTGAPTLGTPTISGKKTQVKISAGSVGEYRVSMTITTSMAETIVAYGYLDITAL